jgi:hypothetical protein
LLTDGRRRPRASVRSYQPSVNTELEHSLLEAISPALRRLDAHETRLSTLEGRKTVSVPLPVRADLRSVDAARR